MEKNSIELLFHKPRRIARHVRGEISTRISGLRNAITISLEEASKAEDFRHD
jgi:hypothetical protein